MLWYCGPHKILLAADSGFAVCIIYVIHKMKKFL